MALRNGKVVDVDLPAVLLELVQLVGREAADDLVARHCDNGDEMLLAQQPRQVVIAWNRILVPVDYTECVAEDRKQVFER